MLIDKQSFQSLVKSEEFQFYQAFLRKMLEDIKEQWSDGAYTAYDGDASLQKNASAIGKAEVLKYLLDSEQCSYEKIMEFMSE